MATATGVYHTDYRRDLALRHTKAEYVRLALLAAFLVVLPLRLDTYWLVVVNTIGLAAIAAVGLNILTGYTGLVSLATGAMLGVGGFVTANITSRYGWPMLAGVAVAVVVAALLGAFFGLPALRLKGLYLAISTLAAQYMILYLFKNHPYFAETTTNYPAKYPAIGSHILRSNFAWYWTIVVVLGLCVAGAVNLFRTGLGRAFIAIRDHDIAAEVMGVPVGRYKVLAFSIACAMAGLSGALTAHYRNVVTWERYDIDQSFLFVAMIIVGGLGSVSGSLYGSAFMLWIPAFITQVGQGLRQGSFKFLVQELPAVQLLLFGVVTVVFLIVEPRGLARLWQRIKDYFRLWPFRY